MDYGQNQANAINPNYAAQQAGAPIPRTIASAIGRVDGLNDRLAKLREHLAAISDQIGGPRPASGALKGTDKAPSAGVVGRLNDSAENAHDYLGEIEGLVACIGRALG